MLVHTNMVNGARLVAACEVAAVREALEPVRLLSGERVGVIENGHVLAAWFIRRDLSYVQKRAVAASIEEAMTQRRSDCLLLTQNDWRDLIAASEVADGNS